jgi:hypothetical protein
MSTAAVFAVGSEGLAVEVQVGVELARAPAPEHRRGPWPRSTPRSSATGCRFGAAPRSGRRRGRGWPSRRGGCRCREPRIVDRRVAEGAGDAHLPQAARRRLLAHHAHDGVRQDQEPGHRRVVQIDLTRQEGVDHRRRQGHRIHLEPEGEGLAGGDLVERAMELEGAAEEGVAPHAVVAEDVPAALDHLLGVRDHRVGGGRGGRVGVGGDHRHGRGGEGTCDGGEERDLRSPWDGSKLHGRSLLSLELLMAPASRTATGSREGRPMCPGGAGEGSSAAVAAKGVQLAPAPGAGAVPDGVG